MPSRTGEKQRDRVPLEALHYIQRESLLQPGDHVAVAVSGGADSVALLQVLHGLRDRLQISLSVAHFNHRLRGAESDADEALVRQLAAAHSLPFHSSAGDVAVEASRQRRNLEAAARRLRYAFFKSLVHSGSATKVATGHTADDQAETVLMRLLRGAGTRGLAGIYPSVDGWLVRPLLGQRREPLRTWLTALGIEWREDCTNSDTHFLRNRLRATVLPLLETGNPRLVQHLGLLAGAARDEESFWAGHAASLLAGLRVPDSAAGGRVLKLDVRRFVQLTRAEQRRVVCGAVATLAGARQLARPYVEAIRALACEGQSGHKTTCGGFEVVRVFDILEFRAIAAGSPGEDGPGPLDAPSGPSPAQYSFPVEVPGSVCLPSGRKLSVKLVKRHLTDWGYNIREDCLLEPGLLRTPVTVRNWNPGDTFDSPTGKGTRKIKSLLLAKRVPVHERPGWPVVVSETRIVWVRGFPVAREFRVRPGADAGILIQEE